MLEAIFSADTLWYLMLLLYVPACIMLVVIVLLQKGKGMGFAGAFGGGASEAVFGPRAVRSLPQKITYTMAGIFMVLAMVMSMISGRVGKGSAPDIVPEEDVSAAAAVSEVFGDTPPADPAAAATTPVTTETTPVAPAPDAAAPAPAPADAAAAPAEAAPVDAAPAEAAPATEAAPPAEAPAAEAPTAEAPAAEAPAAEAPAPTESAPAQQ